MTGRKSYIPQMRDETVREFRSIADRLEGLAAEFSHCDPDNAKAIAAASKSMKSLDAWEAAVELEQLSVEAVELIDSDDYLFIESWADAIEVAELDAILTGVWIW